MKRNFIIIACDDAFAFSFPEMVSKGLQQFNDHLAPVQPRQRRFSILESSHPKSDLQPIDFILVYDPLKKETEEGKQKENGIDILEARRTRYETYLKGQQGLVVERVLVRSIISLYRSKPILGAFYFPRINQDVLALSRFMLRSKFFYPLQKIFE